MNTLVPKFEHKGGASFSALLQHKQFQAQESLSYRILCVLNRNEIWPKQEQADRTK